MKVSDIVKADGQLGIIISEYNCTDNETYCDDGYDWEVVAIKGLFDCGCKQDCFHEKDLVLYDWKDYPKTFKEKLKLLLGVK